LDKDKQFQQIQGYLLARYAGEFHRTVAVRNFLESACRRHIDLGLGDTDLASKLCSGDEPRYWQQLSEILLAHELLEAGLALTPSHGGPDFLVEHEGQKIWIEVICPQPTGIPQEWFSEPAGNYPHDAILLRWTAAIKEKAEKLLGNTEKGIKGYIEKGVVSAKDAYVIAVNGPLLRKPYFASITGISQFPYAVEAAFSIGPLQITIDRDTLKAVGSEHQHRPMIKKPNGADVPTHTFLDPAFRPVSAIWAADIDETSVIGNMKPLAVIHNPEAAQALQVGLLPSHYEFVATPAMNDEYALQRRPGRLVSNDEQAAAEIS